MTDKLKIRHVSWWRERAAERARVEFASRSSLFIRNGTVNHVIGRNLYINDDWFWIPDIEARIAEEPTKENDR